ncbi:MAG: class I SAM-dependent methyltransferase [archaeon]|nr:class I SAM-dependent methyltransferase [archaeon]
MLGIFHLIKNIVFIIIDVFYNLIRKSLGNNVYKAIKRSPLGRAKAYYSLPTYKAIYEHYLSVGLDFQAKKVMEVGSGQQYFTAFYFMNAGASCVWLADLVWENQKEEIFKKQKSVFLSSEPKLKEIDRQPIHISVSLKDVEATEGPTFDLICSHFVLEHVIDLKDFFDCVKRLLRPGGICYNFVDLSNHSYHIFDSRRLGISKHLGVILLLQKSVGFIKVSIIKGFLSQFFKNYPIK